MIQQNSGQHGKKDRSFSLSGLIFFFFIKTEKSTRLLFLISIACGGGKEIQSVLCVISNLCFPILIDLLRSEAYLSTKTFRKRQKTKKKPSMTIIDILHFPGHVVVDHVLVSLFLYVIGLFHMCRGMHLIQPSYYWRNRNNKRRDRKIAMFMMLAGFLYALIHLAQMGIALRFSESQLASLHNLYAFLGFGFFLAGLLKHAFSKNCFVTKSLDPSILIGLGGMSLALFFHPGFTDQNDSEDYKLQIAIQTGKWLYQAVAIFLFFIGLTDLLEQIQKKKWLLVQGCFWIGTAILFVISSEEIIKWMTLGAGASFGMGPVVMCCVYFVGIHVLIFAWISSWKNRDMLEEVSSNPSHTIEDYEEEDDENNFDVHMPVYSQDDVPMTSLQNNNNNNNNQKIPARPSFTLKDSDSDNNSDDDDNKEENTSSSSSSSSSEEEEKKEDDALLSDDDDDN